MNELIKASSLNHQSYLGLRYEFIDEIFERLKSASVVEGIQEGSSIYDFNLILNRRFKSKFDRINISVDKFNVSRIVITPNVSIADAKFVITINFSPENALFYMNCELCEGTVTADLREFSPITMAIEIKHICVDALSKWHWKCRPNASLEERRGFKPEMYFIVGKEDF